MNIIKMKGEWLCGDQILISTLRDDEGYWCGGDYFNSCGADRSCHHFQSQLTSLVQTIFERLPAKAREFKEIRRQKAKRRDYRIFKPDIYFVSFICRCGDGKCIDPDGKNYRRADMNRAIESVFAEYQKELLEEYEIFAWMPVMRQGGIQSRIL